MFNLARGTDRSFREGQVIGGIAPRDADSYRTIFCGKLTVIKQRDLILDLWYRS